MLTKDANARFSTMQELVLAIRDAIPDTDTPKTIARSLPGTVQQTIVEQPISGAHIGKKIENGRTPISETSERARSDRRLVRS